MSVNEGILEEFHLSLCSHSHFRQSHGQGLSTALPLYLNTKQIQGGFFCTATWHYLCGKISQKKEEKKKRHSPLLFTKMPTFLTGLLPHSQDLQEVEKQKGNISICLPIYKRSLHHGEVLPTAILTLAPLQAQCSASVCRGARPHLK